MLLPPPGNPTAGANASSSPSPPRNNDTAGFPDRNGREDTDEDLQHEIQTYVRDCLTRQRQRPADILDDLQSAGFSRELAQYCVHEATILNAQEQAGERPSRTAIASGSIVIGRACLLSESAMQQKCAGLGGFLVSLALALIDLAGIILIIRGIVIIVRTKSPSS